jgi:hypothetical protein
MRELASCSPGLHARFRAPAIKSHARSLSGIARGPRSRSPAPCRWPLARPSKRERDVQRMCRLGFFARWFVTWLACLFFHLPSGALGRFFARQHTRLWPTQKRQRHIYLSQPWPGRREVSGRLHVATYTSITTHLLSDPPTPKKLTAPFR